MARTPRLPRTAPPAGAARPRTGALPRRGVLAGAALAGALLLAGCASGPVRPAPSAAGAASGDAVAAASASPLPACRKPPAGSLPHSAGSLDESASGSYCLPLGQRIDIFLTAVSGSRWSEVRVSDHRVVAPANSGVLTAPVGVTPAMFVGTARGTTVLTSTTASGRSWRVTLVVS